jgi:hypothetical protein
MLIGCQEQPSVITSDMGQNKLNKETSLILPAGVTIESADLIIFQFEGNNQQNNIHRITSPWTELGVTWNNFGGAYDPAVYGSFTSNPVFNEQDSIIINIKDLVVGWANCSLDNYGLLIDQLNVSSDRSLFYSRENINPAPNVRVPYLRIVLSNTDVIEVLAEADSYIWASNPDDNYGSSDLLNTGYLDGYEKQTLIKFDILCTPVLECETAFAYDDAPEGTCFLDLGFDRWGWSIYLSGPGTYTFPVYAAAGQCDLTKGTYVGDVTAVYSGGTVDFTYDFEPGFSTEETHFYAGYDPVAKDKKGKPTVAPGQYKIGTGLSGGIYIIAHAVVCSSDWD